MAIRSKYQPFSFQERIAPLMALQEQYDKTNENLMALGEQATQYYQYLDPETRKAVDRYNQELDSVAGSLASEGMKAVSRNTLTKLRTMYNNEVKPINAAAQTLAKMYEDQRNLENRLNASGQRLFTSGMPTVKDLLENPGAAPNNVSSGALYTQGMQASKSTSLRKFSETAFGSEIINGYINTVKEQGYSPELIAQFMSDVNTIPELREAYNSVKQMYNTNSLTSPEEANQFIMQGILDGIVYSRETSQKEDIIGKENRAFARQKALAKYNADLEVDTARRKAAIAGKDADGSQARRKMIISPRAVNTASQRFYDSKTNTINIPDYLFDKNGKLVNPVDNKTRSKWYVSGSREEAGKDAMITANYNSLYNILREYYSDDEISEMTKKDVESIVGGMVDNSLQDAEGNSGLYWTLSASDTKGFLSRVGDLHEVKSKENGKWTYSPDTKKVREEHKDKESQLVYDPVSNELFLSFDNGKSMYHVEKGMISDEDVIRGLDYYHTPSQENGGMNRMDYARSVMQQNGQVLGSYNQRLESGDRLTPEEQQKYMTAMDAYSKAAGMLEAADELYSSIGPTILSYLKKRDE